MMAIKILDNGRYTNIQIEDARIGYKNFAGNPTKFNARGGVRSFSLFLDPEVAEVLSQYGFYVRAKPPREGHEDDGVLLTLPVNVGYKETTEDKGRDPVIVMISSRGRTTLTKDTVGMLDWAMLDHIDLIINPYRGHRPDGTPSMTAWLDKMYVTIREDDLDLKYSSVPSIEGELPDEIGDVDPF